MIDFFSNCVYTIFGVEQKPTKIHIMERKTALIQTEGGEGTCSDNINTAWMPRAD